MQKMDKKVHTGNKNLEKNVDIRRRQILAKLQRFQFAQD